MAKKKKTGSTYTISLEVNGSKLEAQADTLDAAILKLPTFTPKTKGTIVITKDGKASRPLVLAIPNLKRIFYPGLTGEINRTVLVKRYAFFA